MTIEKSLTYLGYILLALICLLLLPMIVIGSINTLFEGYVSIKHDIFTYLSSYVLLLLLTFRIDIK